jgi:predicted Zn-dependent protease
MSLRILFLLLLLISCACVASAQTNRPPALDPNDQESTIVEEMRVKWEIKYAEKERLENLDRAREAAQLGSELYSTFSSNKSLSQTEKKKLDRLEKVTRKIRSNAGGSDGDESDDKVPTQIEPALKRLSEATTEMRKAVEKTPRQVVSATVIETANEILDIIRFVRTTTR